eukprot:TRINITY_DN5187_c0_g1_i1.p1 TRINITY_DN5187_c0_g1~~TRINITY_DN5187_c0_g1_i1.p1  ORF type:complete len:508 (+),score=75.45 TRINITY_DN5187_c0_g1_i1:171-1694(+)
MLRKIFRGTAMSSEFCTSLKGRSEDLLSAQSAFSTRNQSKGGYKECLVALNSLQSNAQAVAAWRSTRSFNPLDEMRQSLDCIGINQTELSRLKAIHVAGTKGKGGVCAFTESILRSSGFKTGLYVSPHLVTVRERICLNGRPIDQDLFVAKFWECWDAFEKAGKSKPSFFKFLTLVAFRVFVDEKVDVAVVETGIGGRTDVTNVIESPVVTGITSIGFDHMEVLGNTLGEIAFEKSGIFKPGVPAFSVPQVDEPLKVLQQRALELSGANLNIVQSSELVGKLRLGLEGEHNKKNATLAVEMCKTWLQRTQKNLSADLQGEMPASFVRGLETTTWLGRSQTVKIPDHRVKIRLDGAHTQESIEACKLWFQSVLKPNSTSLKVLVFNCAASRDPLRLLPPLVEQTFDLVIFTTNETGRQHILQDKRNDPKTSWQQNLQQSWTSLSSSPAEVKSSIPDSLERIFELEAKRPDQEVEVLIVGSLHLVGAWLEFLTLRYQMDFNGLSVDPNL